MKQSRFKNLRYKKTIGLYGIIHFSFEVDGITGFATIELAEPPNWHNAHTNMEFQEGSFCISSKLSPKMLEIDEEEAVLMLALNCKDSYTSKLKK